MHSIHSNLPNAFLHPSSITIDLSVVGTTTTSTIIIILRLYAYALSTEHLIARESIGRTCVS